MMVQGTTKCLDQLLGLLASRQTLTESDNGAHTRLLHRLAMEVTIPIPFLDRIQ